MSYTVCVQSSSGMRFAFQAQGKALLHFGCTGAMLCVSSLLQDWAGYSDPRWSALTGSVGSKQQSSLTMSTSVLTCNCTGGKTFRLWTQDEITSAQLLQLRARMHHHATTKQPKC